VHVHVHVHVHRGSTHPTVSLVDPSPLANTQVNGSGPNGGFYGNGVLFGRQIAAVLFTVAYSVIATTIIFWVLWAIARVLRTDMHLHPDIEDVDDHAHGERAYQSTALKAPSSASAAGQGETIGSAVKAVVPSARDSEERAVVLPGAGIEKAAAISPAEPAKEAEVVTVDGAK